MPRRRPIKAEPGWLVPILVLVMLVVLAIWLTEGGRPGAGPQPSPAPSPSDGYLYCQWNVENFFDDRDDPRNHDDDEDWFGRNPALVASKVARLADALLAQNGGLGPDILAMVEVESLRAVELLRDALNARLPTEWRYRGIAKGDYLIERRLAPAVLTRLAVRGDRTRQSRSRRILEAHLEVEGVPLVVLASHWTSRIRAGTEEKRVAYAEELYDDFLDLARDDPAVDLLISGDFNDEPDDPSVVVGLNATGDPARARVPGLRPRLLDLLIGKDPDAWGTYFYDGRWQILDHIVASPGLLDPAGWLILPETLRVEGPPELRFGRNRRPWRFGGPSSPNPRGYSDHFAVTVRLRVREDTGPIGRVASRD